MSWQHHHNGARLTTHKLISRSICERCQAAIHLPTDYPPELDPDTRLLTVPRHHRRLDMVEVDILGVLWRHQGTPVTSDSLIRLVWGAAADLPSRNTIAVHITKLRHKLSGMPYSISNVFGGSYVLRRLEEQDL